MHASVYALKYTPGSLELQRLNESLNSMAIFIGKIIGPQKIERWLNF